MFDGPALDDIIAWQRPSWHRDAACREHAEVDFVPPHGVSAAPAMAVCAGCLVREECAAAGIAGREYGVWGMTTRLQRQRLRLIAA